MVCCLFLRRLVPILTKARGRARGVVECECCRALTRDCTNPQGSRRVGEGSSRADRGAPVGGVSGSLSALDSCGGSSAKNKVVRILADPFWAISPGMKHLFVDKQYSPSINMD
jgi:hypothetical protein